LEKEQQVGGHLKVRRWNHQGSEALSAPESVHHALELCWVDEGRAIYDLGRRRFEVVPGELMIVPAGVEHATAFASKSRANSLWLSADAVAELDDRLGASRELEAG